MVLEATSTTTKKESEAMSNSRKFRRSAGARPGQQPAVWPDWKVNLIVDDEHCDTPACRHKHNHRPAIGEPDVYFAYTVGLHQRHGLPEIHMPALGDRIDVGAMSYDMLARLTNAVAERCVLAGAGPGTVLEFGGTVAGGRVTYVLTLGEPGPREAVSAFQTHHKATVIPVGWTAVAA